ncbi:trehalose-phosphatase, partial [Burkholderia pseudomallei]
ASETARAIDSIHAYLNLPGLPLAGVHGAERRDAKGDPQRVGVDGPRLLRIERERAALVVRQPGLLHEHQGAARALQ